MKSLSSKSRFSRRQKIIVTVVILALAGVGVAAYYIHSTNQENMAKKERETSKTNNSSKKAIMDSKNSTSSGEGLPEDSSTTTTNQVSTSSSLSVTIMSTSQTNGIVKASARTSGNGTCVFLYKPGDGGKPVTRQVGVDTNSCSVDISQNEFTYLGSWNLTVTYYSSGNKAEASQNVTIN